MFLHREFLSLSLVIVAFAASSNVVAAASSSDRHLRGSSDEGDANTVKELPSDLADYVLVDNTEERELKQGGNGSGKGQGQGNGRTSTTTTTTTPTATQLSDGGAVAPDGDVGDPVSITETVCDPACGSDQFCAREYAGADAQCYDKCSGFPLGSRDTCNGICVFSIFEQCEGYENVFNEYCECGNSLEFPGTYAEGCRHSECGLFP